MSKSKQRTREHLIDERGEGLLKSQLPKGWLLRNYRPDYGIDFALEVFQTSGGYETLGEHVFIQLKSTEKPKQSKLKLYSRPNVEKSREVLDKSDLVGELDTVPCRIEMSELATVERMGIGVPVLLVTADVSSEKCYFVCLNDYIDKILIPRFADYRKAKSRTIHVPILNEVGRIEPGITALRWYGKRAKLMAAFQRFTFQCAELDYAVGTPLAMNLAEYFAYRLLAYDFWNDTEMCGLISHYGSAIRRFAETGSPGLMKIDSAEVLKSVGGDKEKAKRVEQNLREEEVVQLWRFLSVLPRNYEDIWREWFLPTPLGYLCSYI